MTTVLVRADASASSGSGHVVRQLTLAAHLVARGAEVVFASRRTSGDRIAQVRATGYEVIELPDVTEPDVRDRPWPAEVQRRDAEALLADGREFDVVVVDSYHLDATWERLVREVAGTIVAVDDLDDRERDVDLVVDQNWYGPETVDHYTERTPPGTRRLLGPWYALLQPEYAVERAGRGPVRVPPQRVMVAFGGADVTGETTKVVQALADARLGHLVVDVVVGAPSRVTSELEGLVAQRERTTLHVALPTLAPLFARADLAVGASGAATWERMCLRTPAIVATTRPEQSGVTSCLAQAGVTTWVGLTADMTVDAWRQALLSAVAAPAPVPHDLVDGLGAARVAEAILPGHAPDVYVRRAVPLDQPLFMGCDLGTDDEEQLLLGSEVWDARAASWSRRATDGPPSTLVVEVASTPLGTVTVDDEGRGRLDVLDVLRHRPDLATMVVPAVAEQASAFGVRDLVLAPGRLPPASSPHWSLS